MKYTDDRNAKIRIWARERKVQPLPRFELPFKMESRKFNSQEEFEAWKSDLIRRIAKEGGLIWKK